MKKLTGILLLSFLCLRLWATSILIPMDNTQTNHLKAYGIAYWVLQHHINIQWLLNYKAGSFLMPYNKEIENELVVRGVSYQVIADAKAQSILQYIANPDVNMSAVKLETAPKIAVYSPKNKRPWDDAVTMVLTYAEIPYTVIYDEDIINGALPKYDWLHLHHEDFTGQYGKFYANYHNQPWYREEVSTNEAMAHKLGFKKVSQLKLAVAEKIKAFVAGGGFLFAMCSATDTYDIALAAKGLDICASIYDGDGTTPDYNSKLNYNNCLAFTGFTLVTNPLEYEFSNIDMTAQHNRIPENLDNFTLFDFSAKWDPVPTMLCQDHKRIIKGFMGQTTAFNEKYIKPNVLIMGENKSMHSARYIHGDYGKGTWTFYGGHDPEDYKHYVGDPPTDLSLHPNSPGYRLILNNILFPAAKKKKRKT